MSGWAVSSCRRSAFQDIWKLLTDENARKKSYWKTIIAVRRDKYIASISMSDLTISHFRATIWSSDLYAQILLFVPIFPKVDEHFQDISSSHN